MASGLEFVGRLNDSLKSSASTYIKSKSAERADAEKVLDSIDKEINYRERLITRYQNSTTRGKQAFGAYAQLYSQLSKIQSQNQDQIRSDRLKLDNELKTLEDKNKAYYEEANKSIENISSQIVQMKNGQDLPADIVGAVISRLNKDKVSDEGRLVLFAFLADEVEKGQYPKSDELLNEIKRETAKVVKTGIDPIDSADKPDFLDPRIEASIFTPAVTDDFKAKVHNDPVLQKKFLGRVVTQTQDHSPALTQLYSLMFEDGTEGLSDVQVAQKVVSSISSSVPNTIGINQQGQVTLIQGADPGDTSKAIDLLKRSGIEPGTTIAEAGRALKVQSGREDLSSLTNEIAQLKQRREIAVENLAKTPRLSTSKLALLDHPILRVPGFREAIGTVSARRTTPSVIGAEKTDSAGDIEFGPTDFAAGDIVLGESRPIIDVPPSRVSLSPENLAQLEANRAALQGTDEPVTTGVPVRSAVFNIVKGALQDLEDAIAANDEQKIEASRQNLVEIAEDFARLPNDVRNGFRGSFSNVLAQIASDPYGSKSGGLEGQILPLREFFENPAFVPNNRTVSDFIESTNTFDEESIKGTSELLDFLDNEKALGKNSFVLGFDQTGAIGTIGYDFKNAIDDIENPQRIANLQSIVLDSKRLNEAGGFTELPGMYGEYSGFRSYVEPTTGDMASLAAGLKDVERQDLPAYDPDDQVSRMAPTDARAERIDIPLLSGSTAPAPAPKPTPVAAPKPAKPAPAPTPAPAPAPEKAPVETPDPPPVATAETPDPPTVATAEPETEFRSLASLDSDQRAAFDRQLKRLQERADTLVPGTQTRMGSAMSNMGHDYKGQIIEGFYALAEDFGISPSEMNPFISEATKLQDLPETNKDTGKPTGPVGNPASPKMTDDEIQASLMRSINTLAEGADDPTPTERNIDTLAQGADDKMPTLGEASTMITVDPLPSKTINRPYFTEPRDHPILDDARGHKGIDLAAKEGDPIQLIASGTVSSVKRDPMGSAGIKVEVDHPNGMRTKYFHGSGIPDDIQVGQQLDAGTTIMFAGSSGVYTSGPKKGQPSSTGPHLHFEVGEVKDGQFIAMDPEDVFPEIFGEYKRKREDQGNPSDEDVLMQYM